MNAALPPRPQLLTVDDEVNILKSLKRTLRRCDVDITIANSGKQALELMAETRFDVIMSDMRMPEMSGAEFLEQASILQPDSRRILLTGYSDLQSTIDAINKGGVSTYLAKPWDDDHLIRVVNEAVALNRLIVENAKLEEKTRLQNEELIALNSGLEEKVEERTVEIRQASAMLEQAVEDLTGSYDTMVSLLADAAALRDKAGSVRNEEKISLALTMAEMKNLPPLEKRAIGQAMQLHRIGRLSLPDYLFSKPFLSLSPTELATFNKHPVYAEATLMGVPELNSAAQLIRHQNERWDGKGFPDKCLKDTIPLGSRILTLARDYYDLLAGQYDERKLTPQQARAFISDSREQIYDPELVDILSDALNNLDTQEKDDAILTMEISRLKPGMSLAHDLKSPEGMMLLRKDQKLTENLIEKLTNLATTADVELKVSIWCP